MKKGKRHGHGKSPARPAPKAAAQPAPKPVSPAVMQRLKDTVALHQAGRIQEAEAGYRAVLQADPRNADALHLLGVLALQTGQPDAAVPLIERAIGHAGDIADYHDNHGSALAAAGRPVEAAAAHARALRLRPDHAPIRFNLGNALQASGDATRATVAFHGAVALRPDYGKAWYNLGNAERDAGRLPQAVAALSRAVTLLPGMAEAHNNLGDVLSALGRADDAVGQQRAAVALRPHDATAHYNLGAALQQRGSLEEAEIAYREALKRAPGHVGALNNLGSVLKRLGRPQQAELCHREALRHRPDFTEALYNLGNALLAQGRAEEAAECYERALEQKPGLATATFNLARMALRHGDLGRGWHGHERRFAAGEARPVRHFDSPRWQGEPLAGRRLLVWREQGVGDEIMFASCYGDLLADAGGPVTIEAEPRLVPLFTRSFPTATIRAQSCDDKDRETVVPTDADLEIPAGSLPRLLRAAHADFPTRPGWLVADAGLVDVWQARLAGLGPGLRVGIAWRSQLMTEERRSAYTRLDEWAPLFALPGLTIVNVQYGPVEDELSKAERRFGVTIHRWADLDLKDDFENTAAMIAGLDLVVSVASSAGELAASLGVPVWRFGGPDDWSALGAGCRPWYPTMRLFHSRTGETLADVLVRIAHTLRSLAPAVPPSRAAAPPQPCDPQRGAAQARDPQRGAAPARDPQRAAQALDRGLAAHRMGRLDEAAAAYRDALDADPADADSLHLLGLTHHQSGRSGEAVTLIRDALALDPDFPQARNNLGLVLEAAGRETEAGAQFSAAVTLRPDFPEAMTHLGLVEQRRKRFDVAERWHRRALRVQPGDPKARTNLGSAIELAGRFGEARAVYRKAVAVAPVLADGLNNLGTMARALGDPDGSKAWLARTLRVDPGFALAAWNLGLLQLADGETEAGWAGYERRFEARQLQKGRSLTIARWRGEPLAGRRLLVWNEQGVGDEMLFASCLDALETAGGPVVVECDHRLVPLFQRSFPWAEVRRERPGDGGADLHIAAGSLPALFRRSLGQFPVRTAYLTPDDGLRAEWRRRIDALGPGLKVGIGWRSQITDAHRRSAYTRLDAWGPVLTAPGIVAVNLQYDDCAAEIAAAEDRFGVTIHRWADLDLKDDFESVAALIANLDLVIVPATASGELAGAVGTPVWRIGGKDWTHLGAGVRPWFPTMRLLRPHPGEALDEVVRRAGALLREGAAAAR